MPSAVLYLHMTSKHLKSLGLWLLGPKVQVANSVRSVSLWRPKCCIFGVYPLPLVGVTPVPDIIRTWPTYIKLVFSILFNFAIASAVVPYLFAISVRVSPFTTV